MVGREAQADGGGRAGATLRPQVPGAREQYELQRALVLDKLSANLKPAMEAGDVDMWLIADREPTIDPVAGMIGGCVGDGNVFAFWREGAQVKRGAFISHGVRQDLLDSVFGAGVVRFGYEAQGFAPHLRALVQRVDPSSIAINASADIGMADGLTSEMLGRLRSALGPYSDRLVSASEVVRTFVTRRTALESTAYRTLARWSADLARMALSSQAITVGSTTADDLHWWLLEQIRSIGLASTWAVPGIRVTRAGHHRPVNEKGNPLLEGDVVNLDVGLSYLGYKTDIKRNALVLGSSGNGAPDSLRQAFDAALEARDVLASAMRPGRTGHVVWSEVMEWGRSRGYGTGAPVAGGSVPTSTEPEIGVYCHSVGSAVHDAGARIGPHEPGWGPRVTYKLEANCWYALEFHVSLPVPEWGGRTVKVGIEEPVLLGESGPEYLTEPQHEWWTVD